MPSLDELKPFIVLGFALGGVFAMSGVGLVVLYQATGVLNLAYGAIGAAGALLTWELIDNDLGPHWLAYLACIAFSAVVTLVYGVLFGPPFAARDPLVKATATLGLLLILVGWMQWHYGANAHGFRLPTENHYFLISGVRVTWTQLIGIAFPIIVTAGTAFYLKRSKVGTAMRALANDREITSMLGVPVRRVEAVAWFGSGIICGIAGLLLSQLVSLEIVGLTFLVIPALAAALIGQLKSLWVTLAGGFVIGLVQSCLAVPNTIWPSSGNYRTMTPFVLAIVAILWVGRKRQVVVQT
jgi:branched-chain amino acid transport system permease protein